MKRIAKLTALYQIARMRPICYAYDWLRMRQQIEQRHRTKEVRKRTKKPTKRKVKQALK